MWIMVIFWVLVPSPVYPPPQLLHLYLLCVLRGWSSDHTTRSLWLDSVNGGTAGDQKKGRERLGNSFLACCFGFEMISSMVAQPLPWFHWNTSKLFSPCFSRLRGDNSFPTHQYLGASKQLFCS